MHTHVHKKYPSLTLHEVEVWYNNICQKDKHSF